MNGPLKMYRTKQVVRHDLKVDLPHCMYKLKNIHASRNGMVEQRRSDQIGSPPKKLDIFDQVKQFLKNNQNIPEMAALELRQEQILQQLSELKKQMDSIRNNLKITQRSEPVPKIIAPSVTQPPKNLPEIIINASPTHPPYSLELIQKLWGKYVFISVKSYTHSSLNSISEEAAKFAQNLENFAPENGAPKMEVRLIWKNVGANTELILAHTPILGEVNILRFLSRLSFDHLNYETYPNIYEIDSLLDTSHRIINAKTKTERASLLQILNKSLGKNQWLAGRAQISVADLAAYSAIRQATNENEVNVNLSKWLQRCASC